MSTCERMMESFTAALAAGEDLPIDVVRHLASCAECAAAAADLRHVWDELGELGERAPSDELRLGFHAMLRTWRGIEATATAAIAAPAAQPANVRPFRRRSFQRRLELIGFAAAALLAGILIGVWGGSNRRSDEVADVRSELRDMRQVLALSLLQQSSASGRLQGVSMGAEVARQNPQVLAMLLETLATDPSPNVRLAVVDALAPRAGEATVQQRLGLALRREEEPLVQIALADALLRADGERARQLVAPLARDPQARPEVRSYIQKRLGPQV
jgi:hypothetical protein